MSNSIFYNFKITFICLLLLITGIISQTAQATKDKSWADPDSFTKQVNFEDHYSRLDTTGYSSFMATKLSNVLKLVNLQKMHAELKDSDINGVLSNIMYLLQEVALKLKTDGATEFSISYYDLLSYILTIPDVKTVLDLPPTFYTETTNPLDSAYQLRALLKIIASLLRSRLPEENFSETNIQVNGLGLKNNPEEIFKIFQEELGNFLDKGLAVRYSYANEELHRIAQSHGIKLYNENNDGNDISFEEFTYQLLSLNNEEIEEVNALDVCNKELGLSHTDPKYQPTVSDNTRSAIYPSSDDLRDAARRCGSDIFKKNSAGYVVFDVDGVFALKQEVSMVLGYCEWLFIFIVC